MSNMDNTGSRVLTGELAWRKDQGSRKMLLYYNYPIIRQNIKCDLNDPNSFHEKHQDEYVGFLIER